MWKPVALFFVYIFMICLSPCSGIEDPSISKDYQDFLTEHIYVYVIIILALFLLQIIVLVSMGQSIISPTGIRFWWGSVHSPENSKHITDWYTFTHILHGFIMYFAAFLILPNPPITVHYSYIIGLSTAVAWEIIENTPCVINRYRKTGASAEYSGDSVLNSFCDSIAMSLGFWVAFWVPWWLTLGLSIAEELILGVVIRDNMVLNVIQLVFPFKCISDWQSRGRENSDRTVGESGT